VEINHARGKGALTAALQWGHVFSDVEIGVSYCIEGPACRASMGPRLFRRGNNTLRRRMRPGARRFNGATSFQLGNSGGTSGFWRLPTASMGPRLFRRGNLRFRLHFPPRSLWLQWGHVFSDVEITVYDEERMRKITASMGPRLFRRGNIMGLYSTVPADKLQWGHVFSDVEMCRFRSILNSLTGSFNGATSFQTWKS